ncbi:sulfatase, partial [Micromonospora sp. KC723]|uniref:sulfatase n=1 Tax=Micromonospora sp. KC723 TaxID=2530381 RepID=UPI00104C6188
DGTAAGRPAPSTQPGPAVTPAPGDSSPASGDDTAVPEWTVPERGRLRAVAGMVTTALALVLVFGLLTAPNQLDQLSLAVFLRVPVEALVAGALLLVLRGGARRAAAVTLGVGLGLLTIVKLLDMGMAASLARNFNLVHDWGLLGDGYAFVRESVGRPGAIGAVVGLIALVLGLLALTVRAMLRLTRLVVAHNRAAIRVLAVLAALWVAGATVGVPVADHRSTALVEHHARQVGKALRDHKEFTAAMRVDAFRDVPGEQLLTGLRGKDVVLAFVESYGRDAVQNPEYAPKINVLLDSGYRRLSAAGFGARSGFLTSPTAGGGSWLAHDTLLAGVWVDNEQRHSTLLDSDRFTLNRAFGRAGWDTVGVMPAAIKPWPEGKFFGYERYYDTANLNYRGPRFNFAPMPDQYTLAEFQRRERTRPDRRPIMAEIPLISSHSPWGAIPRMLDWNHIGDGSIYKRPTSVAANPTLGGRSLAEIRTGYRRSVEYTLNALISYVETYGDDNLVLVFLGDHQPAPMITGQNASRDVPVTVVARDAAVLARISGWNWHEGLRPGPDAPVWRMDTFRDRFLTTFGSPPSAPVAAPPVR